MKSRSTFHLPESADRAELDPVGTVVAWAASTVLIAVSLTLLVLVR